MNFGDYDDFTQDNNPFAGSDHHFSNGIVNSYEDVHSSPLNAPLSLSPQKNQPLSVNDCYTIVGYQVLGAVFYKIHLNGDVNDDLVFRRYSDFVSLRSYLIKFFQTKVIPPVPEKHSISRLLKHPFNYRSDKQIIDRRIRLLNYFLKRLLADEEIRQSEFVARFLDPREKYWSKILHGPPFTNLSSKSIYLTSPRDPTTPSPYFAFLPIPPRGQIRNYQSDLNDSVFRPLESRARKLLNIVRRLESTANKTIRDFQSNREALIELGGFFNIFSIIEDQHEVIEHFGNKIDLNFLNIEVFVSSLTIYIKEKLMVIRLTLLVILPLLHFRKMKEVQLGYLQDIILRRQARLKDITGRVLGEERLDEVIRKGEIQSPSLSKAIANLKAKRNAVERLDEADNETIEDSLSNISLPQSWNRAISASEDPDTTTTTNNTMGTRHKAVDKMSVSELQVEMVQLSRELNRKLIPCFDSLTKDVEYISIGVERSVNAEMKCSVKMLQEIIGNWKQQVFGEYIKSCTEVWGR
ncbi:hypothetical protein FOA43_002936 [Brettanomyces nanus]|uniref:PX domain-containing protein n=1 Tax=Eeniella nana TaxID=13502 RepID=A0A875S788_EENNA|nr:uncharacterized protein FOA43_002936 [Brettanomyces nanus]QPG75579.1 hypothetical protein FOA43_002936 [Brettanomyces nanus]